MTTSDASWSSKLRIIGDLERSDHWHLTGEDKCAFFGEYTARAGYAHSFTNGLIANLKKKPSTRNTPQWRYKARAISDVGRAIATNLAAEAIATTAFIPVPPSKSPNSPDYDDRMAQVARAIGANVDVRELLFARHDREAMHTNSNQRDPAALRASLGLRESLLRNLKWTRILGPVGKLESGRSV
jgi:hypothetical protein